MKNRLAVLFIGAVLMLLPTIVVAKEGSDGRGGDNENRIEIRQRTIDDDDDQFRQEIRREIRDNNNTVRIRIEREQRGLGNFLRIFQDNDNKIVEGDNGEFELRLELRGTREEIIEALEDAIDSLRQT